MSVSSDHSATLLVRVWLEDADAFRARLTAVRPDSPQGAMEDVATVASPSEVLVAVSAWLDAFLGNSHEAWTPGS
jgi:hypothetical protein